jgi:hypothetical protein
MSEEDSPNFSKLSDPCRMQNQSQCTPSPTFLPSPCSAVRNLHLTLAYAFPNPQNFFCVFFSPFCVDSTSFSCGFFLCAKDNPNQCKWWQNFMLSMFEIQRHGGMIDGMSLPTLEIVIVQHQSQYYGTETFCTFFQPREKHFRLVPSSYESC